MKENMANMNNILCMPDMNTLLSISMNTLKLADPPESAWACTIIIVLYSTSETIALVLQISPRMYDITDE